MPSALLVFGWGNPARGDDALGPLFVQRLGELLGTPVLQGVELLEDFQLQIEHALDLVGRRRILFVDASAAATAPFEVGPVVAGAPPAAGSHALSPQALLNVYHQLHGRDAPPCTLLAIRGQSFGLGEPLSDAAGRHLEAALRWGRGWVEAA